MKYDNKHIKQKLRQGEALPEGFAWEAMQEGILIEMDAIAATPSQTNRWASAWSIGIACILVMLFGGRYFLIDKSNNSTKPNAPNEATIVKITNKESNKTGITIDPKQLTSNVLNSISNKIKQQVVSTNKAIQLEETTTVSEHPSQVTNIINQAIQPSSQEDSIVSFSPVPAQAMNRTGVKQIESTEQLARTTVSLSLPAIATQELNATPFLVKFSKQKSRVHLALELYSGLNTWAGNYQLTQGEVRADLEQEILGQVFSVMGKYRFSKHFFVTTGVQWEQLQSRFKYEKSNTTQIEARDVLVGLEIDVISNDTTFIYQDTMLNVIEARAVQHYNQHQLLTLPLVVGREWTSQKWNIGVGAGGTLAVQSSAKGRTLYEDEVINYNQNAPVHIKNYGFALTTNVQIDYALSKDLYIGARIGNTTWLKNWSTATDVQMKPNVTSLGLVLGKKF